MTGLTPRELAEKLRHDPQAVVLLDVREDDERAVARIDPSVHIPMGEIARRYSELPANRPVVVYCHYGGRSEMVAGFLESRGFLDVANLDGGIDAWAASVDPSLARY